MSIASAKTFIDKLKTDLDFAKRANEFESLEQYIDFLQSHGFDFTESELLELQCELTDAELQRVDGGFVTGIPCPANYMTGCLSGTKNHSWN